MFFLGGIPFQDPATRRVRHDGLRQGPGQPVHEQPGSDVSYGGNAEPDVQRQPAVADFEFNRQPAFPRPEQRDELERHGEPGNSRLLRFALGNSPAETDHGRRSISTCISAATATAAYDPNDVNFPTEADANLASPIWLQFFTASALNHRVSPAPNPYTTSSTVTANDAVTYEKAQTFQIFSPGADGLYGVGGQYHSPSSANSSASTPLPFDANNTFAGSTAGRRPRTPTIRVRERDNLTNFQSGKLNYVAGQLSVVSCQLSVVSWPLSGVLCMACGLGMSDSRRAVKESGNVAAGLRAGAGGFTAAASRLSSFWW